MGPSLIADSSAVVAVVVVVVVVVHMIDVVAGVIGEVGVADMDGIRGRGRGSGRGVSFYRPPSRRGYTGPFAVSWNQGEPYLWLVGVSVAEKDGWAEGISGIAGSHEDLSVNIAFLRANPSSRGVFVGRLGWEEGGGRVASQVS